MPYWIQLDVDGRIVAFTVLITGITTIAIGLLPALRASRPNVVADLKEGGRGASLGRSAQRLQGTLAVAQVALCLALLVGANLMIRSFLSLQRADLGFDESPMLTMRVYLAGDAFNDTRARARFFGRAVDSLTTLPGRPRRGRDLQHSRRRRGKPVADRGRRPHGAGRRDSASR